MPPEPVDLDVDRLNEFPREYATRLFQRLPQYASCARMVRCKDSDEFFLIAKIPSPTEDAMREIVFWIEETEEPSVGFGEWHTHASVESPIQDRTDEEGLIIDLIEGILADQIVLIYNIGGKYDGDWGLLDLRDEDALLDELTDEDSLGRLRIKTWSGESDREVGLDDLTI